MKTKKVSDELALELTKRFLENTCHGDALRIKTSELSRFIEFETGHTYTQHTLRRCIPVREYIKAEQEKAAKDLELQVIVYKPLDVRQLVRDNTSPDKLVEAISEVDHYYKQVSDYAFRMLKERDKAWNEIEELKTALAELTEEHNALKKRHAAANVKLNDATDKLSKYKNVLYDYVYSDVADTILRKEGILKGGENEAVTEETATKKTYSHDTEIGEQIEGEVLDELPDDEDSDEAFMPFESVTGKKSASNIIDIMTKNLF